MSRRTWLSSAALGATALLAACRDKSPAAGKPATPAPSTALPPERLTETPAAAGEADYPPARTGLRGDHDGSFTTAHQLRDGAAVTDLGAVHFTQEHYDLVVVGGGLSGLAAAYFYRQQAGADARILILDNHDDFGGHAKRNEFNVDGRLLISYGGSQSIAGPSTFSDESARFMKELGVEMAVFEQAFDRKLLANYSTGWFLDRSTFGRDHLLRRVYETPWSKLLKDAPLSERVRRDVLRLYTEHRDYLAPHSVEEKADILRKTSYADYLTRHCSVHPDTLKLFQTFPHDLFAVGIDAVSAWSCYHGADDFGACVYPGFDGLGLPKPEEGEPYIYHFPDGNASVARLLVRALIPSSTPGSSMHDIVLAQVNYAALDRSDNPVRLRLNSTVVEAKQLVGAAQGGVEVTYSRQGKLERVTAKHGVLACYNAMIPYLCPQMPEAQRKALSYLVRMPLVYTHVALRNWKPFVELGLRQIVSPGSYYSFTSLDFPVSLGQYQFPKSPEEPAVLFMLRVPCKPGLTRREQNRAGRAELLATRPGTYEEQARTQLAAMLQGTSFDAVRDIAAVTVNRWAHGYAFIPNRLFDPEWQQEDKPWIIGRQRWGNFTIANSDAGASAYMDVAIDQAYRAVREFALDSPSTG